MKKRVLLILSTFVLLLFIGGCTLNDTTGLITITNYSDKAVNNIKVGDTYVGYLASGAKYDLWYYSTFTGKMAGDGIDKFMAHDGNDLVETAKCKFKINYQYDIRIILGNDEYCMNAFSGAKSGDDWADDDPYHHPAE